MHKQWGRGNVLVYACVFRVVTYALFMLTPVNPRTMTKPQTPMAELMVSFDLNAGGIILFGIFYSRGISDGILWVFTHAFVEHSLERCEFAHRMADENHYF